MRQTQGRGTIELADRLRAGPALAYVIAVGVGSALGLVIVGGSLKLVAAALGVLFVALGVLYPRLIMYVLVILVVFLSEKAYALQTDGAFRLSGYVLDPLRFNLYEVLVYCLLAILVARRALASLPREVPAWITVPCIVTAVLFLFQLGRSLLSGVPYAEAMHRNNGEYVLAAVAALWCFCELLGDRAKRLQLLDLLFVCATGRAAFALARYAFGSGDSANAYESSGVKVALWESADHLLFVFLIAVAIAAWAGERVAGRRLVFWAGGSVLMALTVMLSFRRTGWFGLIAALVVVTVVLLGRYRRSVALIPGLLAVVAAIGAWSYTRFASGGSMVDRLLPDVLSRTGSARQDEWALAWRVVVKNPVLGDLTASRGAAWFAPWPRAVVHNAFLFAWMHLGLAGVLCLIVLATVCIAYAIRGVRARGAEEHIALGAVAVVPFTLFLALFATPLIELRTMFILALVGALAVRVATALDEPSEAPGLGGESGLVGAGIG